MPVIETGTYAADARLLIDAVREAGQLALKSYRGQFKSWTKDKTSIVSEIDIALDRMLHDALRAATPDYGWLSEETKDDLIRLKSRRVWIVDPIDGTRAYVEGLPNWSVAAALVEDGRPVVGVVYAPVEDALFSAVKDEGAQRNGTAIRASDGSTLSQARIAGPQRALERLSALEPGLIALPKIHSLALRLTRVAEGAVDIALASTNANDWDLAAADLLVHEAGGKLTDVSGNVLTFNKRVPVHPALVAAGQNRQAAMRALMTQERLTQERP